MKRRSFILVLICLTTIAMSLVGCNESDSSISNSSGSAPDSSNAVLDGPPVGICSFSDDEITEKINSCDNLKASGSLFIDIPKESKLYEYVTKASAEYDFNEYYEQFLATFEYLFPDHKINDEYLFYIGGDSQEEYDDSGDLIKELNKAKDHLDELKAGKQGRVNLLYDETWNKDVTKWDSQVCLELGAPIGYGYAVINKGNAAFYSGTIYDSKKDIQRYPLLEAYDPIEYFNVVGVYSPKSTERFMLTDKETAINDAVTFFENYVNSLPYPGSPTLYVTVREVFVLEIEENVYGYYYLTSAECDNVPFDYMRSGVSYSGAENNYVFSGGNGFMLKSDDVDIVYSLRRLQKIESPSKIDTVVSFDNALQTVSTSLTSNIVFEVQKAEFVYREQLMTDSEGHIDTETMPRSVSPSWKFTLYNSNDDLTYICYVGAKEGKFSYETTNGNMELKQ